MYFKVKYETNLEFPRGVGDFEKNPLCRGGMDIFLEPYNNLLLYIHVS